MTNWTNRQKAFKSLSCSLVHHDQGHSKNLRGGELKSSLCVHESLMWADKTAVWAAGSDVRSANYAAFFFWLRLAALYFFFPLTLMTLLFDLVNNANSYFLYLGTGVKWGCDQPCACPRRSSHLLLTSPGALCSFANRPSPVLCPTVASQIPAPSRLSVLSFYIVDTLTNQPGIIFHSLQAGFLIYSPHPDGCIRN